MSLKRSDFGKEYNCFDLDVFNGFLDILSPVAIIMLIKELWLFLLLIKIPQSIRFIFYYYVIIKYI